MKRKTFDEWFDLFYRSKEAQEFCFGNYNNATRDEQVGEFCAKKAFRANDEYIEYLERCLDGKPTHWSNIVHDKNKEIENLEACIVGLVEGLEFIVRVNPDLYKPRKDIEETIAKNSYLKAQKTLSKYSETIKAVKDVWC